ncbi:MAG TPA: bifunctional diguanylate cyclase/phosphodiesterase, partial [Steroidobacteraceae bacterium]
GLPNRRYFLDQVDRALREMRTRSGREIAALLISVGRYKVVTDTLGHTAGDELMVQITRLANQALAGQEFVLARWADDELALLVSAVHSAEGVLHIARLLQQALQTPIEIRRHRIMAATSMGATYVESGLQRAEEVLREADIALSSAKAQGGSRLVSYSSAMQTHLMQQVSLEGDLQQALERQEFRLMFQPIVALSGRQIVGMEVLLRWLHPVEGLLRPERFLSSAEEAGLSVAITRWIIQRTCQIGRQWRSMLPADTQFYFSVNLSTAALLDPELSEYVRQALSRTEAAPAALKFEVTENSLISNVGAARQALDRLHALGVELMLDDFGTGYSSLSHLQLFPFDYIKIDGPFDSRGATTHPTLAGAHHGPDRGTAALVRAMTQMADALGLKTVAEIVETTSAVNSLQQFGCQFAQGNVFSPPVDADQAFQRLRARILEPHDAVAIQEPEPEEDDSATMILPVLPETMIE